MPESTQHPDQEILELEERFVEAVREADFRFLESTIDDNYVFIGSDGSTWGQAKALADFRNPAFDLQRLDVIDRRVFMHGDTAIVTGISVVEGRIGDDRLTGRYRFMRVWCRYTGWWKVIAVCTSKAGQDC